MTNPISPEATVAAFAHACDFGSIEDYARLLDEAASMTTIAGSGSDRHTTRVLGREAIVAGARLRRAEGDLGPGSGKMHVLGPSSAEYTSDDAVLTTTHWMLVGVDGPQPSVLTVGYYRDRLVRADPQWRIVGRSTHILSAPRRRDVPATAAIENGGH